MTHTHSSSLVYPDTVGQWSAQHARTHTQNRKAHTQCLSHSLAISGASFSCLWLPLAAVMRIASWALRFPEKRCCMNVLHLRDCRRSYSILLNISAKLWLLQLFLCVSERRHGVNPRLGSRAMPWLHHIRFLYSVRETFSLSINICVGTTQHAVAICALSKQLFVFFYLEPLNLYEILNFSNVRLQIYVSGNIRKAYFNQISI